MSDLHSHLKGIRMLGRHITDAGRSDLVSVAKCLAVLLQILALSACTTIAPFSQPAYELATSTKAEALSLMDKAVEDYSSHKAEVEALRLHVAKGYEYANGRVKNEVSTKQWAIIKDPDRNSLGGFLKRWETAGKLSPAFVKEAKGLVGDGFDTVIGLESGKVKPDQASAQ